MVTCRPTTSVDRLVNPVTQQRRHCLAIAKKLQAASEEKQRKGTDVIMQGGHGYGGYGYDAGAYASTGGYGYDAGAYASATASAGGSYYSSVYYPPPAPAAYEEAGRRRAQDLPAPPLDGVELKPSEACPKNYVIFDQTSTSSWVTFHPSLAHRLTTTGGSSSSATAGHATGAAHDDDLCSPVRHKEDSAEIDALMMSSEDGSGDDDVTSTGRAPGNGGGSSPDSTCSSTCGGGGGGMPGRKKKDRIKKMMRTLKGIIPGGGQMDTTAALDEAVCYLKSLNVQANKRRGSYADDCDACADHDGEDMMVACWHTSPTSRFICLCPPCCGPVIVLVSGGVGLGTTNRAALSAVWPPTLYKP
ncbi:hypothetical protein HU200_043767 [Digitaria exilis]|uniref:BHLH domain-containing protein n=1 Tax=Digitaria exilis TaxID=1010633 RepID=A0A835B3N1_9POAL|nr:hypothetical protein HU200_043767 [Digitaria exilis]